MRTDSSRHATTSARSRWAMGRPPSYPKTSTSRAVARGAAGAGGSERGKVTGGRGAGGGGDGERAQLAMETKSKSVQGRIGGTYFSLRRRSTTVPWGRSNSALTRDRWRRRSVYAVRIGSDDSVAVATPR